MLRIKLVKSPIGNNWRNRRTVVALGLRKVNQTVEQPDNPSVRGMIHHVQHMVTFEVVEGEVSKGKASSPSKGEAKAKDNDAPRAEAPAKKAAEKPVEKKVEAPVPKAAAKPKAGKKPKPPAKAKPAAKPVKKTKGKA